jgi:hypothetical protein
MNADIPLQAIQRFAFQAKLTARAVSDHAEMIKRLVESNKVEPVLYSIMSLERSARSILFACEGMRQAANDVLEEERR